MMNSRLLALGTGSSSGGGDKDELDPEALSTSACPTALFFPLENAKTHMRRGITADWQYSDLLCKCRCSTH